MTTVEFTRTGRGLAHYYLFYNVDLVVFCEGGLEKSEPRAVDQDEESCIDYIFWRTILDEKGATKSALFKLVGSKTQVKTQIEMAREIEIGNGNRSNVLGCVDRDYDDYTGLFSNYKFLDSFIMTDGYSVENDLFSFVPIEKMVLIWLPRGTKASRQKVVDALKVLDAFLGRIAKIDCFFRAAGIEFLPTDGVPSFLEKLTTIDDVIKRKMVPLAIEYRRQRLRAAGVDSFGEFRVKFGLSSHRFSNYPHPIY